MNDPNDFYPAEHHPDRLTTERMWHAIAEGLPSRTPARLFGIDRRSFVYGMAATFLLFFTGIGIYTSVTTVLEIARPPEVRAEDAYRSAIREFEQVVSSQPPAGGNGITALQSDRLSALNAAIDALRMESGPNDLSPLKRKRLNDLYQMKLEVLQQMLRKGEQRI